MNPKVLTVETLPNYRLSVQFTNGEHHLFDVNPYLSKGVFQQLRNLEIFKAARVIAGSVEWPGGIDLSYDTLYLDSSASRAATAS